MALGVHPCEGTRRRHASRSSATSTATVSGCIPPRDDRLGARRPAPGPVQLVSQERPRARTGRAIRNARPRRQRRHARSPAFSASESHRARAQALPELVATGPRPSPERGGGQPGRAPRSRPGIGTHGAQRAAPSPPLRVAVREVPRGGCRAFSRPPGPTPAPTVRPAARRRGPVGDDNSRPGRTGNIPLEVDPAGRSDAHPTHGYARGRPSGGRALGHPATSCEASAPTRPGPHPRRLLARRASSAPRRIAKRGSGAPDGAVLDSPGLIRTGAARRPGADQHILRRSPRGSSQRRCESRIVGIIHSQWGWLSRRCRRSPAAAGCCVVAGQARIGSGTGSSTPPRRSGPRGDPATETVSAGQRPFVGTRTDPSLPRPQPQCHAGRAGAGIATPGHRGYTSRPRATPPR